MGLLIIDPHNPTTHNLPVGEKNDVHLGYGQQMGQWFLDRTSRNWYSSQPLFPATGQPTMKQNQTTLP